MKKKCVIIKNRDIPIVCIAISELEPIEFIKTQKECEENFKKFIAFKNGREAQLEKRIADLEHRIAVLEGTED